VISRNVLKLLGLTSIHNVFAHLRGGHERTRRRGSKSLDRRSRRRVASTVHGRIEATLADEAGAEVRLAGSF
jgi:hypothetical protein